MHLWIDNWVVSTFGSCDVCCEHGVYRYFIKILLPVLFLLCTEVELLDHLVVLFLIFQGIIVLFSVVSGLVCIPINSERGFPFLYTLSNIYCL